MEENGFNELDFYGKVLYVDRIVCEGINALDGRTPSLTKLEEITIMLENHFKIFAVDVDLNNEVYFRKDFDQFKRGIANILGICPLIKSGDANYGYLIPMLKLMNLYINENLPNNIRLARFFKSLLDHKGEISERIDVDVNELSDVLEKMFNNVDAVNEVISADRYKRR